MVDPVPYLDMVLLEAMAQLIATDSGGYKRKPIGWVFHVLRFDRKLSGSRQWTAGGIAWLEPFRPHCERSSRGHTWTQQQLAVEQG